MVFLRSLAFLVVCLLIVGCAGNPKLTKANYDKIKNGMDLKQVEDILGPGEKQAQGDGSNVAGQFGVDVGGLSASSSRSAGDEYVWESGGKKITITLVGGKVTNKTSTGL
jgi:hypothetical protein